MITICFGIALYLLSKSEHGYEIAKSVELLFILALVFDLMLGMFIIDTIFLL